MGRNVGNIHRHIAAHFLMAQGYAGISHSGLKGKAASQQERNQILPPQAQQVVGFPGQLPLFVHPIAGNIGADVGPGGGKSRLYLPGLNHFQQGAGFGIALAEKQEVKGQFPRQYRQVSLDIAGRDAGSYAAPVATADFRPGFPGGLRQGLRQHISPAGGCRVPVASSGFPFIRTSIFRSS